MRYYLLLALGFALSATALFAQDLYVGQFDKSTGASIARFNGATGVGVGSFGAGTLAVVRGLAFNPGGDLFVLDDNGTGSVHRFSGTTNAPLGTFASVGGSLAGGLNFGPNGDLYSTRFVSGVGTQIVRMNGVTGAITDTFNADPGLGFASNNTQLAFGPDGDIFVSYSLPGVGIRRYDGTTGAFEGTFVPDVTVASFAFGPGGDLFIQTIPGNQVRRFDGTTGADLGVFATGNSGPIAFGTDGDLFTAPPGGAGSVIRFDGTTGAFEGVFTSGLALAEVGIIRFAPVPEPGCVLAVAIGAAVVWRRRRGRMEPSVRQS